MTAASESSARAAMPVLSEVDCPSAWSGFTTACPFGGSRRALATAPASWPRTTTTSSHPPPAAASTACWTSGRPATVASCFVEPNRVPRPAARTIAEITGRPAGSGGAAPPEQPPEQPHDGPPEGPQPEADTLHRCRGCPGDG